MKTIKHSSTYLSTYSAIKYLGSHVFQDCFNHCIFFFSKHNAHPTPNAKYTYENYIIFFEQLFLHEHKISMELYNGKKLYSNLSSYNRDMACRLPILNATAVINGMYLRYMDTVFSCMCTKSWHYKIFFDDLLKSIRLSFPNTMHTVKHSHYSLGWTFKDFLSDLFLIFIL